MSSSFSSYAASEYTNQPATQFIGNLVEIIPEEYNIVYEPAYATTHNFTGRVIYTSSHPRCYLHKDAAIALKEASRLARALGLKIKIFDAFRPIEAQAALFEHTPMPGYVSDPKKGEVRHTRGIAVDLTLIDASGEELEMGTPFDSFTLLSHHNVTQGISIEAQKNRFLLLGIMNAAGFHLFKNEWWHYEMPNFLSYPILSEKIEKTQML